LGEALAVLRRLALDPSPKARSGEEIRLPRADRVGEQEEPKGKGDLDEEKDEEENDDEETRSLRPPGLRS
jgi:hypothetical protein